MYSAIDNLMNMIEASGKQYDTEAIKKAYLYANELHCGQFRQSGEPYITHPIAVAEIVASLGLDTESICAALLHDTVEDCGEKIDLEKLRKEFGDGVALLVDGLTKLVQIPFDDKEEEQMENLRKMFLAMSKDIRVIFIKLCDRLHNMRTLNAKADHKQRNTALETMHVYAPLAHRLGMQRIKQQLENLALSYLDPIGYNEVKDVIDRKFGLNRDFLESEKQKIENKLRESGFDFSLEGRVKSVYSIYKKMYEKNKSFDEIFDFYALRIIVSTELECYTVLGIIHDMFNSVPGRFKDYISTPKPNMYRSLHTTVIGRNGIPFEVQIRTWEMHQVAEYGIAAHWKYKSGEKSRDDIDQKLSWVRKLIETENETLDHDDFLQALKIDIFHDETFVFTPKGDVITLPLGSTVIDFAYAIHSQVGNKMTGAKINGMIVPIDRVPQNGEIVEILTSSSSKGPSRDWLKIVKTSEARNKIRQWFKREMRDENIIVGEAEIEKELKRFAVKYTEDQKKEVLTAVIERLGIQEIEDLYNTIGYGGLSVSKISGKLRDALERIVKIEAPEPVVDTEQIKTIEIPKHKKALGGVIVDGVDGCAVKFAKCCNPLPGDPLIGFITKGFGISIHNINCPNVKANQSKEENNERWVSARWNKEGSSGNSIFEATFRLFVDDRIGMLADITAMLADMKVSLTSISTRKEGEDHMVITLSLGCKNLDHANSMQSSLRSIKGVESVTRGYNL